MPYEVDAASEPEAWWNDIQVTQRQRPYVFETLMASEQGLAHE